MDPQARVNELMESARFHTQLAYWAALIAAWGAAVMLAYGAYGVHTKGLNVTEGRVVRGGATTAVAVAMVVLAVGLAGGSTWFLFFSGR
jgi:hypothetical protein